MSNREVLDSWKEIAAYLNRSVKTCQRLEKDLGLPVHRLEESPKARVFAYPDELDRWIEKTQHSERKTFLDNIRIKRILISGSIVTIFAIAILLWQFLLRQPSVLSREDKISLVVLPFEDLSPSKELEYLADGIADELISRLNSVGKLKVPARTSAFSFKNRELDIKEIGQELNVDYVLDGSIQKTGDRLRIRTQLADVKDGYPIWSEKFERDAKDIFSLQDEISFAIVDLLKISLVEDERKNFLKRYTENVEAYNSFLMGLHYSYNLTSEGGKKAIEYFQQSIQEDPNFAPAYLGLAGLYFGMASGGSVQPKEVNPKIKSYIQKALEIDDTLAEGYAYMGHFNAFCEWNFEQAEKNFKKALSLNPYYPDSHLLYAMYLRVTGRHEEGISELRRALELDPLNPILRAWYGLTLFCADYDDEAFEVLRAVLKTNPYLASAHLYLGTLYAKKSMIHEAISEMEKAVEFGGERPTHVVFLAKAYWDAGKKALANKLFQSLRQRSNYEYISPTVSFYINHFQGDEDQALEWVKRACEERDSLLIYARVQPVQEHRIPDTPKFNAVLRKYGLERPSK